MVEPTKEQLESEIAFLNEQYKVLAEEHATLKSRYSMLILRIRDLVLCIGGNNEPT